jgi:hypothetical protein
MFTDRQTYVRTDRQTDRQTDRRTDGRTDRRTHGQTIRAGKNFFLYKFSTIPLTTLANFVLLTTRGMITYVLFLGVKGVLWPQYFVYTLTSMYKIIHYGSGENS